MDQHALAILAAAESWDWPGLRPSKKYNVITPSLLSCFITQSQMLGGTLLSKFWAQVGKCHPRMKQNIEKLERASAALSPDQASSLLFEGIDQVTVNFEPIFEMTAELFTHLGSVFMDPERSGTVSDLSSPVSEIASMKIEKLLKTANDEEALGDLNKVVLKELGFRRDGTSCLLTGALFATPAAQDGHTPTVAQVIPNSMINPDSQEYIALFAGRATRDFLQRHMDKIGNTMNMEFNAHMSFKNLWWGIEAVTHNETTKYIYRTVIPAHGLHPGFIQLRDGDEIHFGGGPAGRQLGQGPLPLLCNLRLAVARVFWTSGTAGVLSHIRSDADVMSEIALAEYPESEELWNILTAKLLLSLVVAR